MGYKATINATVGLLGAAVTSVGTKGIVSLSGPTPRPVVTAGHCRSLRPRPRPHPGTSSARQNPRARAPTAPPFRSTPANQRAGGGARAAAPSAQ